MNVVRAITIRDVARRAGVSLSTVSQVLNGRPGYASAATRDNILRIARELGYRPNALARGLVTSRTGTPGLVITDITRAFFTQVVGSIEQVASRQGYSVLLACADGILPEQRALETFVDKRVDGIICMSTSVETSADHILQVNRLGVPLVMINRPLHTAELNQIAWDEVSGARKLTEHLIGLGHRRIGMIVPDIERTTGSERLLGYCQMLAGAHIAYDDALIIRSADDGEAAYEATLRLLRQPRPPTALFADNDRISLGAMRAIYAAGLRIPDDVSVVGYCTSALAASFAPPLTSVVPYPYSLGTMAAETMLRLVTEHESASASAAILPMALLVRASTAPPRRLNVGTLKR